MDRVAVLGEEGSTVDLAATAFQRQGVAVTRIECCADVSAILSDTPHILVIRCLRTSERRDLKDLPRVLSAAPDTLIVPASFTVSLDMALAAIRLGAFDILTLPSTADAVRALLDRARLHRQEMALRRLGTLSQLSRWFAHEVRNPLSGILNSAQLLTGGFASSDLLERYLQLIVQEGERIEEFLKRVTELGRSQRGPLGSASLNGVAERALARAKPQLHHQHIQLKREFDPRVPEVHIDAARMESAVSRLIANAVAAMPTGGVMTVLTRHRPDAQMIDFEVTDTDLETGPERERQLFGRFESTKLKEAGLGLVAALQTFIDHGGEVSFRILPGQGCSIVAQLPVNGRQGRP